MGNGCAWKPILFAPKLFCGLCIVVGSVGRSMVTQPRGSVGRSMVTQPRAVSLALPKYIDIYTSCSHSTRAPHIHTNKTHKIHLHSTPAKQQISENRSPHSLPCLGHPLIPSTPAPAPAPPPWRSFVPRADPIYCYRSDRPTETQDK
jgi:hypothetical protein